ncbi:MAG: hypothetical protein JW974_01150 [Alphaproteobacteria bacterium]|nr:hypothetical protein [Alphaproteobacteria bacterium]MBN2675394.1 hypothetical protein [Alphaproteobacteria bacterium]
MKTKPSIIAQKLLNLYRQHHVIFGGWKSVNQIFINEASPEVMMEIKELPTGKMLAQHIENLRSGKTPIDSIAPSLTPYGGLMSESSFESIPLSDSELAELENALADFVPDTNGLAKIKSLDIVKRLGDDWQIAIRSALYGNKQMLDRWKIVLKTERAYYLWKIANDILVSPISERSRAQIQADLPEYETYLPMFGDSGKELLSKLRIFVSSI